MPRLGQECNSREVNGAGEDVAPARNQRTAEGRIKKIFLNQLPGHHLARARLSRAGLFCNPPGALPRNMCRRRRGADQQCRHSLTAAIIGVAGGSFRVKTVYQCIFDFICVAKYVAVIEAQNVGEIFDPSYVVVSNSGLDNVLPLSAKKLVIKDAINWRRPKLNRPFERLPI